MNKYASNTVLLICIIFALFACAPPNKMGMITAEDGYQYGSVVEDNLLVDSSQFENARIKLTLRNTSGDLAYDLGNLRSSLENNLTNKGYLPTQSQDFGILLDVNLLYSGYAQSNLTSQYAFLGGTAGGIAGYDRSRGKGAVIGAISGATLAGILGSYSSDDTYIIIAEVTLAVADLHRGKNKKVITFSSSPPLEQTRDSGITPFQQTIKTKVSVYAGGRNVKQSEIANGVRKRLSRIVADII